MGRRGPAPIPTRLKIARGNPGHQKLSGHEPEPEIRAPEMPKWLEGYPVAVEEWDFLVPRLVKLGLLAEIDRETLAIVCYAVHMIVLFMEDIDEQGFVFQTESGYESPKPSVTQVQKFIGIYKAFMLEFGLSPSARARLRVDSESGKSAAEKEADSVLGGAVN